MSALDFPLPSGRVLCAVSGGADSVCLLHSCLRLARGGDTTVCAAHYNHCLRGGESDRDERFVRSLCASLGVELRVGRGDVAAYARGRGMGTEEAARSCATPSSRRPRTSSAADTSSRRTTPTTTRRRCSWPSSAAPGPGASPGYRPGAGGYCGPCSARRARR